VVLPQIATSVSSLYDELLALDRSGRERQPERRISSVLNFIMASSLPNLLVTGTAPSVLSLPSQLYSGKSVRQIIIDGPWALICAHICLAPILASVLRGHVGERVVLFVAGLDGLVDGCFA
jgi:hypothetical protein